MQDTSPKKTVYFPQRKKSQKKFVNMKTHKSNWWGRMGEIFAFPNIKARSMEWNPESSSRHHAGRPWKQNLENQQQISWQSTLPYAAVAPPQRILQWACCKSRKIAEWDWNSPRIGSDGEIERSLQVGGVPTKDLVWLPQNGVTLVAVLKKKPNLTAKKQSGKTEKVYFWFFEAMYRRKPPSVYPAKLSPLP